MRTWKGRLFQHTRLFTYSAGSLIISFWTVLAFLTQRTIFDLVGQQVLTQQLIHGGMGGATIGITNYIPKMFLLYAPMVALPGSPRLKLIVLTAVVNVAAFILLGLVLERLLRMFSVRVGGALYLGLLWLACVAGSVFWIQFTNSRNLEVVGGLFLIYESLRYVEHPGKRRLVALLAFSTLLFFADTLQVYMTAVPLIVYVAVVYRENWRRPAWLAGTLVGGYVLSKIAFIVVAHALSISFIQDTGGSMFLPLHQLLHGTIDSIKSVARLYSSGVAGSALRRIYDGVCTCVLAVVTIYAIRRKLLEQRLLLLVALILVVNMAVYILSGQALQQNTDRYLIMTAPAILLLLGGAQKVWIRFRPVGIIFACLLVVLNGIFLSVALAQGFGNHFSQDAHLASARRFVAQHPSMLAYSSMDTAIPSAYLSGADDRASLPLACAGSDLRKDSLFYSKSAFQQRVAGNYKAVAIILDGTAISNMPSLCTETTIIEQLGMPYNVIKTDDGSTVLLYGTNINSALHY